MIPEFDSQPSHGLVIVFVRIEDEDRFEQAVHRLVNLTADQICVWQFHDETYCRFTLTADA